MVVALAASSMACTQGVAPDVPNDTADDEITITPVSATSTAPPAAAEPNTLPPAETPISSTRVRVAPSVSATTSPPTFSEAFASAVAPIAITVFGTSVSVSARDSVARLWLLVGRPPTDAELRTAVTAIVRDGVPLDALATLLVHSGDDAVGSGDVPPDQFVAQLYERMLARPGKPDEVAAWVEGLAHGMSSGEVAVRFAESPEAVRRTGTVADEPLPVLTVPGVARSVSDSVLRLYLGLLVRLPTADELDSDVARYVSGVRLGVIASDLLHSDEYRARRPHIDPRSVLSGLFEDVLGSPPTQAAVARWSSQLENDASAGEIAAAFTESAAVVNRTATTLPVPPAVPASLPPPVAITAGIDILAVGDSVMLGASNALTRQFPGVAIDAKVGRQFSEGLQILRTLATLGTVPGTVIVHLGTNGAVSAERCDKLMDLIAGKRVVLVNVHVPRPWESPNNDVLAACAARHGATIVDWHTNAVGLAPDGYHLGRSGPDAYATLIAAALAG